MFVVKVHVCFRPRTVHTTSLCGNLETKQHTVPVLLHTLHNYIMFVNSVHLLNKSDISTACTSTACDHYSSMKKNPLLLLKLYAFLSYSETVPVFLLLCNIYHWMDSTVLMRNCTAIRWKQEPGGENGQVQQNTASLSALN